MAKLETVRATLQRHGQEHLLQFYGELDESRQAVLLEQIAAIDFEQLDGLIKEFVFKAPAVAIPPELEPAPVVPAKPAEEADLARNAKAVARGRELLAAGKVAAFVVAGGQGTRLGYEGPKGCLEATPVTRKPLFQLFAEQILAASRRHKVAIPWYIMTSPANDVVTRAFFRQQKNFGLPAKDVFFFVQGSMPSIGLDGKVLLAGKDQIALSPDGHGGCLLAMRKSGALGDMAGRGIDYISYFQVDNPLVRCLDPLFIGHHDLWGAQMSAKALPKRDPMEKLGNICASHGKVHVIEYSDMPEALATACREDGHLKFGAGSIAIHVMSRSFVEKLTQGGRPALPFHRAVKKVSHVDKDGNMVKPSAPNAVKLEMFVFDALPLADSAVILQTLRSEEFSPIKNAAGEDSLTSSLHDQVRRAAAWLEAAGITVPRDADGHVAAAIEISPLYADSAEELAAKVDKDLKISTAQSLYLGSRGQTGGLR
jgi:UDP-N-acetylglucosamine/UDP-N-acetylgalactosamine diphosphorylase